MFRLGDTFLAGEQVHGRHHFWIIINDPAQHVRAQKLHRNVCPGVCIATSDLKDGDRRRSNDEILQDMLSIGGLWKDAEEDMLGWREKIGDSLQSKREKLSQPNFQLFDENWLLIFDDPPLAEDAFTYDRACRHLATLFSEPAKTKRDFDTVFIYSDRYLISSKNALPSSGVLPDTSATHSCSGYKRLSPWQCRWV